MITAPSSAIVIPFEASSAPKALTFVEARETWLRQCQKDQRLTHADRALATQIYRHLNREHSEKTGELLAWPGWETITAEGHVSETSIRRGLKKLESLGHLEIIRNGRDLAAGVKESPGCAEAFQGGR
jgi:hypothetical protein